MEPKLYDNRIIPNGKGVMLQTWYGPNVKWSSTKWFDTEKEAQEWLKGGVPSSPDPKRKSLPKK